MESIYFASAIVLVTVHSSLIYKNTRWLHNMDLTASHLEFGSNFDFLTVYYFRQVGYSKCQKVIICLCLCLRDTAPSSCNDFQEVRDRVYPTISLGQILCLCSSTEVVLLVCSLMHFREIDSFGWDPVKSFKILKDAKSASTAFDMYRTSTCKIINKLLLCTCIRH